MRPPYGIITSKQKEVLGFSQNSSSLETHKGFIYEETDSGYVPIFNTEDEEVENQSVCPEVEEEENLLNFRKLESDNQLNFLREALEG